MGRQALSNLCHVQHGSIFTIILGLNLSIWCLALDLGEEIRALEAHICA